MSDLSPEVLVRIITQLAQELGVRPAQVQATVNLLDEGATVPFIARYRKEVTGNLDDTQLRTLDERLVYLRDMEARRIAVLDSIREQGKLSPELEADIQSAETKQRIEDLYAPYKQKRRTRAQIAIEAGLEPLADALYQDASLVPLEAATAYINADKGVTDAMAALDGAKEILAERFADNADLVGRIRERLWNTGVLRARRDDAVVDEGERFRDYYEHDEAISAIPSHRALALFRGRTLGIVTVKLGLPDEEEALTPHPFEASVAHAMAFKGEDPASALWRGQVCRWTWRVKLAPKLETELLTKLREAAEQEAIRVFAGNLRDRLLAAPAGPKAVMGLDPGIRTGVKVAVVDATGKLLDTATVYPFQPRNDVNGSLATLAALAHRHQVELVAIGNGTASRETARLVAELTSKAPFNTLKSLVVTEAGASVYSASETAAKEFPDLDVSLRGAVSIARRLQDPLAELVKIDPKALGVGQYQHDVDQRELARTLDTVVEDCVNAVGVDVNTASQPLLARVSGLTNTLAKAVVEYRDQMGPFKSREALRKVPRFGEKTFELAAGFLRIQGGENPLDRSGVHPEAYGVVQRILEKTRKDIGALLGDSQTLRALRPAEFTDQYFGEPTVRDILSELEKPGRDPRPEFRSATHTEGIESVADLREGMILEGTISNVTNFGAFVDIGVHQDGLVHISELSDKFVKDPREVVRPGDIVKVRVVEVDIKRNRVALSMKSQSAKGAPRTQEPASSHGTRPNPSGQRGMPSRASQPSPAASTAMASAFAKLKGR